MLHVETFEVGPLGCNCSVVADVAARRAIVVDPGGDLPLILASLQRLAGDGAPLTVEAIVHTHTHIDHVGATAGLQRASGARACIHEADRFLYDLLPVQAALLRIALPERTEMEGSLSDGTVLACGAFELGVLHTPGHTPGSVSFVVSAEGESRVFTGDTLFQGGIGRTDLWGGDSAEIMRSLRGPLLSLPDTTLVIPGHGDGTTIGHERRHNPFLRR